MLPTEMLQPPALGLDHASGESKTAISQIQGNKTNVIIVDEHVMVGPELAAYLNAHFKCEIGQINDVQIIESRFITNEEQCLYHNLREQGLNEAEAKDTLKLMGVFEPSEVVSRSSIYEAWGREPKEQKKKLPFYHHKRRF